MDRTDDLSILVRISHLIEDLEKNGFDNEADLLHNEFIKISSVNKSVEAQSLIDVVPYFAAEKGINPFDRKNQEGGLKLTPYPYRLDVAPKIKPETTGPKIPDPKWSSPLDEESGILSPWKKRELYKKFPTTPGKYIEFKKPNIPKPEYIKPEVPGRTIYSPELGREYFQPFDVKSPPLTFWDKVMNLIKSAGYKVKIAGSYFLQFLKKVWFIILNSRQILPVIFGTQWDDVKAFFKTNSVWKTVNIGVFNVILNVLVSILVELGIFAYKVFEERLLTERGFYKKYSSEWSHVIERIKSLSDNDKNVINWTDAIKNYSSMIDKALNGDPAVIEKIMEESLKPIETGNVLGLIQKFATDNNSKFVKTANSVNNKTKIYNNNTHALNARIAQHRGEFWHELGELGTETLRGGAEGAISGAIVGTGALGLPTAGAGAPIGAAAGAIGGGILGALSRATFDLADNAVYASYSKIGKAIRLSEDLKELMRRWLRPPGTDVSRHFPPIVRKIETYNEELINYLKAIQYSDAYQDQLSAAEKIAVGTKRDSLFTKAKDSLQDAWDKGRLKAEDLSDKGKKALSQGFETVEKSFEAAKSDAGKAVEIVRPSKPPKKESTAPSLDWDKIGK